MNAAMRFAKYAAMAYALRSWGFDFGTRSKIAALLDACEHPTEPIKFTLALCPGMDSRGWWHGAACHECGLTESNAHEQP
jgi:hypothetical protein